MMFYPSRTAKNRFAFAGVVIACWTAYGVFFGTQSYLRAMSAGKAASLPGYLITWLICGYTWAIITVPVLRFIRRFSLERLGWSPFLLTHIAAAPVVGSTALALYVVLATALLPGRERPILDFYQSVYLDEILSEVLVYLLIVGAVTIYQRVVRQESRLAELPVGGFADGATSINPEYAHAKTGLDDGESLQPSTDAPILNGHLNGNGNGVSDRYRKRISIKDNGRISLVNVDDISWISSYGNYLKVHTTEARYIYRETMTAIERDLDPSKFVRIRRSAIVRVDQVKELRPGANAEYEVILKNETVLTSTRRYRRNLEALLNH